MRRRVVAGNWKMNKTPSEAVHLVNILRDKIDRADIDVVICVPTINLLAVAESLLHTNIKLGAENLHYENCGAYTGETSATMLKEIGVQYVIVGHSERRNYFKENDSIVNKKVLKALEHGIKPILCVGESIEEREDGITIEKIRIQVKKGIKGCTSKQVEDIIIAYEPIWAIGTGMYATTNQAQEVCYAIRQCISEKYGEAVANKTRILYGGSVSGDNAKELFEMEDIDGGLVGGASLKEEFVNIVNISD